jgi:hypothetical protein
LLAEGEPSFPRAVEIATLTWNKLPETPVISFGFNFFISFPVEEGQAGNALCALLPSAMLKFDVSPIAAEYRVIGTEDDLGQVTVDLRPADQSGASIAASINYHFTPEGSTGYFDLGSAINNKYAICLQSAKKKFSIVKALLIPSEHFA